MHERMNSFSSEYPQFSEEWYADLYLQNGSVEEVLKQSRFSLPISPADYHRKIKNYGIVKNIGRRRLPISKLLYFFAEKAGDPSVPVERLYHSMPPSIKESASIAQIHRVYQNATSKITRLRATGLVVTSAEDPENLLVADELTQRSGFSKKVGDTTIPFSFANKDEPKSDSVLRVLQQELSTKLTVEKHLTRGSELANTLAPKDVKPFLTFQILDIGVDVYHIDLPEGLIKTTDFSSYKVANHRFMPVNHARTNSFTNESFRMGIPEIITEYKKRVLRRNPSKEVVVSSINQALFTTAKAPSQRSA